MRMTIEGVDIPTRGTVGSAGYDIHAPHDIVLTEGVWTDMIDLGILMEPGDIPLGCVAEILPRSSTGSKWGLKLRNTTGVIDSDYTMATIKAVLSVDFGYARKQDEPPREVVIQKNDRILQMIVHPFVTIPTEIPPTKVREGGLGSTGR